MASEEFHLCTNAQFLSLYSQITLRSSTQGVQEVLSTCTSILYELRSLHHQDERKHPVLMLGG